MPLLPIMIRLDGNSFHTFTKGLPRPYDKRLSDLMVSTASYLVDLTNAKLGYTQSDEISLIIFNEDPLYGGRTFKLISHLASKASVYFNKQLSTYIPEKAYLSPTFDCRAWNVPTKMEAFNTIYWRELDCIKNSISMSASYYYSHKELINKNSNQKQEMLFQKEINWNNYPSFFKHGTYVQRKELNIPFTKQELNLLPPKHQAHKDSNLIIKRHKIEILDIPGINKIPDPISFIFDNLTPQT